MKVYTALFLILIISCLSAKIKKLRQINDAIKPSDSTDNSDTTIQTGLSAPESPIPTPSNSEPDIVYQNTTSTNDNTPFVFTPVEYTVASICSSYTSIVADLGNIDKEIQNLIVQFKEHVEMYAIWRNNSTNADERDRLESAEITYLDDYAVQAVTIAEIFKQIKANLDDFKAANCTTADPNFDPNTNPNEGDNSNSDASQGVDTLIQIISDRYHELGVKSPVAFEKLVNMIQLNSNKSEKSRKSNKAKKSSTGKKNELKSKK